MITGGVQGAVNADEIGLRHQLIQGGHRHPIFNQKIRGDLYNIIAQQSHAEGACPTQDRFPNSANTDHPQSALAEGLTNNLIPLAGFDGFIQPGNLPGKGQHITHHTFRNRNGKGILGIANHHPGVSSSVLVNRINAGPPFGDHF